MNYPKEARVLALERKQARIGDILRGMQVEAKGIHQQLWDAQSEAAAVGAAATCTASFSGNLLGCTGAGLVGANITVNGVTVTTTTGGAFSGSTTINSPTQVVAVTTSGITGYVNLSTSVTLACGANALGNLSPTPIVNHAPTLNNLTNLTYCGDPGAITVPLSGITDGDAGTQTLTVTSTSSNTGQIPNPTVTYTSPNTTGSIAFTPAAGISTCAAPTTISVKVVDNGGTACSGHDTVVKTFTVGIAQPVLPGLNTIGNVGPIGTPAANQVVTFSGVNAGACNVNTGLSVAATSTNGAVSGVVSVSYTAPASTGTLTISIGTPGTATISVTVTDSTATNCHSATTRTRTFTVTVV